MMSEFSTCKSTVPDDLGPWLQDFITGNINTNKPTEAEQVAGVNAMRNLSEENEVLKRCLRLLQDNSALETTTLLSAIVAFSDDRFRRKFADGLEGMIKAGEPDYSGQRTQTLQPFVAQAGPSTSDEERARAATSGSMEEPVRDVPASSKGYASSTASPTNLIHEVPERDGSAKKKKKRSKATSFCPPISPKSPPVSLGGRHVRSADPNPYFYPSEPTSKHLQSHMQTKTAFTTDLEYDALYLRSLALAAGYRALAKGLGDSGSLGMSEAAIVSEGKPYKYVPLDKMCREVSGIPPHIMYRYNKNVKPVRLVHTCVSPNATKCFPFSREGYGHGAGSTVKFSGKTPKMNLKPLTYQTNERTKYSPLAKPQGEELLFKEKKPIKKASKKGPSGQEGDYDFQAVVTPIIDQARHSLQQVTGKDPTTDDLTSFSLQHTHKEYQYKEDGTAVVQSDVYKKSYNWSSEEEGGQKDAPAGTGSGQQMTEIAAEPHPVGSSASNNRTNNYVSSDEKATASINRTTNCVSVDEKASAFTNRTNNYIGAGEKASASNSRTSIHLSHWKEEEEKAHASNSRTSNHLSHWKEEDEKAHASISRTSNHLGHWKEEDEKAHASISRTSNHLTHWKEEDEKAHASISRTSNHLSHWKEEEEKAHASISRTSNHLSHWKEEDEKAHASISRTSNHLGHWKEEDEKAHASNSRSSNNVCLQKDKLWTTSRWLEASCGAVSQDKDWVCEAVSHDRDWANHCSFASPFRVVTPRHSTSGSSHDLLQGSDRRLSTMDAVREVDSEWQPRPISPSPWSSLWSPKEADSATAAAPWMPSPRLDYFPVSQVTGSTLGSQRQWLAEVPDSGSKNLLGEVAFQLERRILDYVFSNSLPDFILTPPSSSSPSPDGEQYIAADRRCRRRLSGCSLSNIGEMISQEALAGERYSRGTERMLRERLRTMLDLLTPMGYDLLEHGAFSQDIINKYGIMPTPPPAEVAEKQTGLISEVGLPGVNVADVQNFIFAASESTEERDTLLLVFDCLRMLSIEDGRPLFVW